MQPTKKYNVVIMCKGWCKLKEQSLLFDLFKAFDLIESSHKLDYFSSPKRPIFLHAYATSSVELLSKGCVIKLSLCIVPFF